MSALSPFLSRSRVRSSVRLPRPSEVRDVPRLFSGARGRRERRPETALAAEVWGMRSSSRADSDALVGREQVATGNAVLRANCSFESLLRHSDEETRRDGPASDFVSENNPMVRLSPIGWPERSRDRCDDRRRSRGMSSYEHVDD